MSAMSSLSMMLLFIEGSGIRPATKKSLIKMVEQIKSELDDEYRKRHRTIGAKIRRHQMEVR